MSRRNKRQQNTLTGFDTAYSTLAIAICSFTFGTNLSIQNAVMRIFVGDRKKKLKGLFEMSEMQWSHAVSILCVGAFLSNILVTSVALNRKHMLVVNNLTYILGQALILLARNKYYVIGGRFFIGIGSGVTCALVPLYFQKLSSLKMRGVYGSLHQLSLCTGVLCGQLYSFHFCRKDNWKTGMYIVIGYLVVHTLMLCFVHRIEESTSTEPASVASLFMNQRSRWSILTATLLHAGQQLSGIRAVIFYSQIIFGNKSNPNFYSGLVGLTLVMGTFISMFVVDKLGRKKMLLFSVLCVSGSLVLLSFKVWDFLGIFGFVMGYSMGLGPIPWFITGEIFPERYKKAGNLVSVSANWIATYVIAITFSFVFARLNTHIFLVFTATSALVGIYTMLFFKETRGRKADFL